MRVTCEAPAGSPEGASEPCLSHSHASITLNPAHQKHYTPEQSTTDSHTSLAQTKASAAVKEEMREKGSKGRLEESLQRRRPLKLQKNSFLLIDESPGRDGIQMWQSGDIKGANSSASPAAVQLGTKWSLSHCILLRRSLWFRICSIIFSSWAKADRRVGRCVLSIPFNLSYWRIRERGGHRLTLRLQSC